MIKETKPKTIGDAMPKIEFYPELPKLKLSEVLNKQYEITDAIIWRDFDSKFGKSDFALLLLTDPKDGSQHTCLAGGMVIVKKIQFCIDGKLLPLLGTISYNDQYYDIN